MGHPPAEAGAQRVLGHAAVLDHVVEHGGGENLRVVGQGGGDGRGLHGMDQIGQRAALAQLAVVGEGREGDGAGKQAVAVEVGVHSIVPFS